MQLHSALQRESMATEEPSSFGSLASATGLGSSLCHLVPSSSFGVGGNGKTAKGSAAKRSSSGISPKAS